MLFSNHISLYSFSFLPIIFYKYTMKILVFLCLFWLSINVYALDAPSVSLWEDQEVFYGTDVTLEATMVNMPECPHPYYYIWNLWGDPIKNESSTMTISVTSANEYGVDVMCKWVSLAHDTVYISLKNPQVWVGEDRVAQEWSGVVLSGSITHAPCESYVYAWTQTSGTSVVLEQATGTSVTGLFEGTRFLVPHTSETLSFLLTVTPESCLFEGQTFTDSLNIFPQIIEIPDTGTWSTDTGTWSTDTGTWSTDTGTWSTDTGTWSTDTGTWSTDTGTWSIDTGTWSTDTGSVVIPRGFSWRSYASRMRDEVRNLFQDDQLNKISLKLKIEDTVSSLKLSTASIGWDGQVEYVFQYATWALFDNAKNFPSTQIFTELHKSELRGDSTVHFFRVKACFEGKCSSYSSKVSYIDHSDPLSQFNISKHSSQVSFWDVLFHPDVLIAFHLNSPQYVSQKIDFNRMLKVLRWEKK